MINFITLKDKDASRINLRSVEYYYPTDSTNKDADYPFRIEVVFSGHTHQFFYQKENARNYDVNKLDGVK